MKKLGVAVIGAGLIGSRRVKVAHSHKDTTVMIVADIDFEKADRLAKEVNCASTTNWHEAIQHPGVDLVVVATINAMLEPITTMSLRLGKHVLCEKPLGRSLSEALKMVEEAKINCKRLKIGFNHRYHPSILKARELVEKGAIGELLFIRALYGHGGRPGYDQEWRCNPELSGGGEMLDQGVHIMDLIHWFMGIPSEAYAATATFVWNIFPLEDNAFGVFRWSNGNIATFHTSWTQWQNLFSFEIYGVNGFININGLGGSYGKETLTVGRRKPESGPPEKEVIVFEGPDDSWKLEWEDWINSLIKSTEPLGNEVDGINAMTMIDALYRSAKLGGVVKIMNG